MNRRHALRPVRELLGLVVYVAGLGCAWLGAKLMGITEDDEDP